MSKGMLDNPVFAILIFLASIILLAPIFLKVINTIKTPMTSSYGNISVEAGAALNKVLTTTITFWDKLIIALFVIAIIAMILSSFLIDTSPVFVIVYILMAVFLLLFSPSIVSALESIYANSAFTLEVSQLALTNFLLTHFGEVLVGVYLITGVIIYGKIRFFGANQ
jgi:hypothetical protein